MRRTSRADRFATLLLSALGLSPLAACGGATSSPDRDADGGAGNGGGGNGGGGNGGAGASGGSGEAGIPVEPRYPCTNPAPIGATGYIECEGGLVHRVAKGTCPYAARPPRSDFPANGVCTQDADCTEKAYGSCEVVQAVGCAYGCASDDDCSRGYICRCEPGHGTCVPATCAIDADCGGQLCTEHESQAGCGSPTFSCQTSGDQCRSNAECGFPQLYCVATDQGRRCSPPACVIGRPFLVAHTARVASRVAGSNWAAGAAFDGPHRTSPEAAEALSEAWTAVALMEHASIAAFARFTLQLMSLGAPVELIEQSTSAMADETRHARLAFALASHFSGHEIGPGPLDIHGALTEATLEQILVGTIREGCIGETVAAMRAAEALEHAESAVIRDTLAQITRDETRHAELAWQFVRWAIARHGDVARHIVEREIEATQTVPLTAVTEPDETDRTLLAGGIVPEWLGSIIHNEGVEGVFRVCARALLLEADQQPRRAA